MDHSSPPPSGHSWKMQTVVGNRTAPGPGTPIAVLTAELEVAFRQNVPTCSGRLVLGVPTRVSGPVAPAAAVAGPRHSRCWLMQWSPGPNQDPSRGSR